MAARELVEKTDRIVRCVERFWDRTITENVLGVHYGQYLNFWPVQPVSESFLTSSLSLGH